MTRAHAKDEADIASEQEEFARNEALWRVSHRLEANRCRKCENAPCETADRQECERREVIARKQRGEF